jgi:hypothetical protein
MMPHQIAAASGLIKPKYPQAPRQWVSTIPERRINAELPTPNITTGIQRNYGRSWSGDADTRFPRFEATSKALALGAIGYVLSRSMKDDGEVGGVSETPPPPNLPPPPSGTPQKRKKTPQAMSTDLVYEDIAEGEIVEPLDLPSGRRQQPTSPGALRPGSSGELDIAQPSRAAIGSGPRALSPAAVRIAQSFSYPGAIAAQAQRVPTGQARQEQSAFRAFPSAFTDTAELAAGQDMPISSPVSPASPAARKRKRKSGIGPFGMERIESELEGFK